MFKEEEWLVGESADHVAVEHVDEPVEAQPSEHQEASEVVREEKTYFDIVEAGVVIEPSGFHYPLEAHELPELAIFGEAYLVREAQVIDAYFAQLGDCREDYDVPIVLMMHHAGRPLYRIVLDIVMSDEKGPQQLIRMWSNWHSKKTMTSYHGRWRANLDGTLVCVFRWFTAEDNVPKFLVSLALKPVLGVNGLYESTCGGIRGLRLFAASMEPDPCAALQFACLIDRTI